jgi:type IV pilus assembly protein PilC
MFYQYIACSESGEIVKGKFTATSEEVIAQMLGVAGYRLINLRPFIPFLSLEKLTAQLFPVKPNEIIILFRQLALLLESGVNIVTSLELIQEQITNRTLKRVVSDVISDIRAGNQLSVAMSRHPEVFPVLACRSLSIGEQTGGIETMLRQVADYSCDCDRHCSRRTHVFCNTGFRRFLQGIRCRTAQYHSNDDEFVRHPA